MAALYGSLNGVARSGGQLGEIAIAMAVDAIAHLEVPDLFSDLHTSDIAMADRTDLRGGCVVLLGKEKDMRVMDEVNMIWKAVDTDPVDGEIVLEGEINFLNLGTILGNDLMAEVALLHSRQHCCWSGGDTPVAELAVDAVGEVQIVPELDGLFSLGG